MFAAVARGEHRLPRGRVKATGEGLYGTGDWPGVGWPTALARVGGFGVASVVLAWVAIIRRAERVPIVFFVALVLPILLVLNDVFQNVG